MARLECHVLAASTGVTDTPCKGGGSLRFRGRKVPGECSRAVGISSCHMAHYTLVGSHCLQMTSSKMSTHALCISLFTSRRTSRFVKSIDIVRASSGDSTKSARSPRVQAGSLGPLTKRAKFAWSYAIWTVFISAFAKPNLLLVCSHTSRFSSFDLYYWSTLMSARPFRQYRRLGARRISTSLVFCLWK